MKIIQLKTFRQPSGTEITLRKVRMVWKGCTNLCVERLVGKQVQEGWYGWEDNTLHRIWNGWEEFEQRIGSTLS